MSSSNSWLSSDTSSYSTGARLLFVALSFTIGVLAFMAYLLVWHLCTRRRRGRPAAASVAGGGDCGMTASAIAAELPTFAYEAPGAGAAAECAVCLGQVQGGEKVRRVPRCAHLFHAECIDMWLYSHSTCPLCRAAVCPAAEGGKKAGSGAAAAPAAVRPLPPV